MTGGRAQSALDRLRAAVLADGALQNELQAFDDLDTFLPRALALGEARGIRIEADEMRQALRPDPIGLSRWSDTPPSDAVPQPGWLPVNVLAAQGQLCIDWAFFGAQALAEPFFEDSIRAALRRPLNRLARHRTRLIDLPDTIARQSVLQPSGLIFHMSRCGSTLVSQMLATDAHNIVVSEAAPVDAVVRLDPGTGPQAGELHAALLASMIRALGKRRRPEHARLFVKLDSWHTLALPLFRRAFPDLPWVFLYREPAAVLASQMIQRGIQTVPEYLPPALFGLTEDDALDADIYCARVLSRTCEAVLEPLAAGGGLLVNYSELPQALWTKILPHFGIEADAADRERMAAAAKFDAKSPNMTFSGSADAKQDVLTDALRATAERHMGAIHRRLETLRRR